MADPDEDEDELRMLTAEGDVGLTVVYEVSSGGSSFGGGSGGSFGGGEGVGEAIGVVVDGASGEVVGTVTVNPDTGQAEASGVDVTVVEETSSPDAASSGSSSGEVVPEETPAPGGSAATPDMGALPKINPAVFTFKDEGPNNQQTRCVPLFLAFTSNGVPLTDPISVPVRITAPRRLADGTTISAARAGFFAAVAANEAALPVQEAVDLGLLSPTEAPVAFRRELNDVFRLHGRGFRAIQCFPPGGP